GDADYAALLSAIDSSFHISGWLFLVPVAVVLMIVRRTQPLVALMVGTLLGAVFALIFQPEIVKQIAGADAINFTSAYKGLIKAITQGATIETANPSLNDLFDSGGMGGMMSTIWLVICALVFG